MCLDSHRVCGRIVRLPTRQRSKFITHRSMLVHFRSTFPIRDTLSPGLHPGCALSYSRRMPLIQYPARSPALYPRRGRRVLGTCWLKEEKHTVYTKCNQSLLQALVTMYVVTTAAGSAPCIQMLAYPKYCLPYTPSINLGWGEHCSHGLLYLDKLDPGLTTFHSADIYGRDLPR